MLSRLFRLATSVVSYCERCGAACTAACRQDALLARGRDQAIAFGGRFT